MLQYKEQNKQMNRNRRTPHKILPVHLRILHMIKMTFQISLERMDFSLLME